MLKKLIKYDFLWTHRVTVWYMLGCLLCGVLCLITGTLLNRSADPPLALLAADKIASVLLIVSCIALFMMVLLRLLARFVNTVYKDQSYFTHTLPTTRETVFDAKAISGAAAVALALAAICLAILIGSGGAALETLQQTLSDQPAYAVLTACLVALEMLCLLFSAYFGFVIGYRFNTGKTPRAVLFTVLIYMAAQNLNLIGLFVIGLFDKDVGAFFTQAMSGMDAAGMNVSVEKLLAVTAVFYLILDAVLYLLGRRALGKGVNVD